ncbi:hypothetical protein CMV_025782 [Castanea mollissima]|uniref:Uncharacterized protein n=1 Tax=Castanea mollissima TaxID=60419 RepID=A0A8J4Q8U7_9ROSI|nr:hypothetical protein CMV_025782 [Castanea mollissima]
MDNLRSLQTLYLTFCKKLKSLPRLPSTIRCIHVEFGSLKWLPAWVKLSIWSQPLSQWLPYDERHSQKEFTILFHFLQVQGLLCCKTVYGTSSKGKEDGSITEFQIIMPSCLTEIVENSISIELPSNWYNSKWIGLAFWASAPPISLRYGIRDREIKVIFEGNKASKPYEIEFGVSLVYEQDVDEFNQTNAQCLIASYGEVPIYKLTAYQANVEADVAKGIC